MFTNLYGQLQITWRGIRNYIAMDLFPNEQNLDKSNNEV
jgi:hypothetical protein